MANFQFVSCSIDFFALKIYNSCYVFEAAENREQFPQWRRRKEILGFIVSRKKHWIILKQFKAGMSHQRMLRERDIMVDDLLFIIIIIDNIIINKYYLSWIDECWTKTRKIDISIEWMWFSMTMIYSHLRGHKKMQSKVLRIGMNHW